MMMLKLNVKALGTMEVVVDGTSVPYNAWRSSLTRQLFFIALDRAPVTRDAIAATLWPDLSPAQVTSNFNSTNWRLNRALGSPRLFRRDPDTLQYCFDPDRVDITYDVHIFEQGVERARSLSNPREALMAWNTTLESYGGTYLPGVFDEWVIERRRALSLKYLESLNTAAKLAVGMSDPGRAISLYQRAVDEDEYVDEAYYHIVRLLMEREVGLELGRNPAVHGLLPDRRADLSYGASEAARGRPASVHQ